MNCRKLLGGGGAASATLTVTGAAAQVEPSARTDAELVALADHYDAARKAYNAYAGPDNSPEDQVLWADYLGTFTAVLATRPTTLEGLAAKARVAHLDSLQRDGTPMEPEQSWSRMARSLMNDVLRLAGGAP